MKLWAIITSHSEVPGDHLMLMHQVDEPTDKQVFSLLRHKGFKKDDLDCITVTHCYDVEHWLKAYPSSSKALAAYVTHKLTPA